VRAVPKWVIDSDEQETVDLLVKRNVIRILNDPDQILEMVATLVSERVRGFLFDLSGATLSIWPAENYERRWDEWDDVVCRRRIIHIVDNVVKVLNISRASNRRYPGIAVYALEDPATDPDEMIDFIVDLLKGRSVL
jgi:hypothetical protein